jgi:hypothetical protein
MRTIRLSIEDARHVAPIIELAEVRDRNAARQIAQERLHASPFHVAVKVREGDELVFWLSRIQAPAFENQASA